MAKYANGHPGTGVFAPAPYLVTPGRNALAAELAFGRGHLAGRARIDRDSGAQRPGEPLEARLGDVMIVAAIQRLDVQRHPGMDRKGLKPFAHQLGVEGADLVAAERGVEHQEGPSRYVDGDAGQRLVHRHVHVRIARDALHVAERLLDRLAERDANVLGGVVVVDMQIALGLHRNVDTRVPRQEIEHVVEEADAGRDVGDALAVEIDRDLDVGLLGGALDRALAAAFARLCRGPGRAFRYDFAAAGHGNRLFALNRALLSGVRGIRHRRGLAFELG